MPHKKNTSSLKKAQQDLTGYDQILTDLMGLLEESRSAAA